MICKVIGIQKQERAAQWHRTGSIVADNVAVPVDGRECVMASKAVGCREMVDETAQHGTSTTFRPIRCKVEKWRL